jgi:hypothetical protein
VTARDACVAGAPADNPTAWVTTGASGYQQPTFAPANCLNRAISARPVGW